MAFITLTIVLVIVVIAALGAGRAGHNNVLGLARRGLWLAALGIVVLMVMACVTTVRAGSVGVVDVFGKVSPNTLKAGLQFVNPLARVVQMSVQTQEIKERMEVPSKEGMTIGLEVSVLYHLDPDKAGEVYRTVGQDYATVILEPQFRSVTRGVTAGYEAKALYTSEREQVAQLITTDLKLLVQPRGIFVESTPMPSSRCLTS